MTGLESLVTSGLFLGFIVVKVWALADCATRPRDAFPAANRRTRGFWLAITGASAATAMFFSPIGLIGLAGIIASLVYLLDVRPRVAEASVWR